MKVGDMCIIERWWSLSSSVEHTWKKTIVRVTPARAYFDNGDWVSLTDSTREVKPRYLDYITVVASVVGQAPSATPKEKP